ncbi:hypothetical protein MMPV_004176 [Pyropia vietnamensis]
MQAFYAEVEAASGVSRAARDAAVGTPPSLAAKVGTSTLRALSTAFYARVFSADSPPAFRGLFSNVTAAEAAARQSDYLIEALGGPPMFSASRGAAALLGRHAPYAVGEAGAAVWLRFMADAVAEVVVEGKAGGKDAPALAARLMVFFRWTAWYIVLGRGLVNPCRVVGYRAKHDGGA